MQHNFIILFTKFQSQRTFFRHTKCIGILGNDLVTPLAMSATNSSPLSCNELQTIASRSCNLLQVETSIHLMIIPLLRSLTSVTTPMRASLVSLLRDSLLPAARNLSRVGRTLARGPSPPSLSSHCCNSNKTFNPSLGTERLRPANGHMIKLKSIIVHIIIVINSARLVASLSRPL